MNRVALGNISGLFGVRGWVKIHSDTTPRTNILEYPVWNLQLAGCWKSYKVLDGRAQGKLVVARLDGVEDRDQAAALVGAEIAVDRDQLPAAAEGEFYWADLEGLQVRNREAVELGIVERLFSTGSNDVMVVRGGRERLVPFIEGVVLEVDLAGGMITVDWDPDF